MKGLPLALLTLMLLGGCASPGVEPAIPPLVGSVERTTPRQIAASLSEVAQGATVALIDPTSGNTLNTTLTDADGSFALSFNGVGLRPSTGPYFLEAVKGLSLGGSANRAGASLIRVRTLVSFQDGSWHTLTGSTIRIGRSTTAMCILSNLKGLTAGQNLALLNRLHMGRPSSAEGINAPDTLDSSESLSTTEFLRAYDLVDRAITLNLDPVAAIFKRPEGGDSVLLGPGMILRPGLGLSLDGWTVTSLSPSTGPINTLVTLYGHGLPTSPPEITASLGGQACSVTEAAADGSYLRFRVPGGLAPGSHALRITVGPWSHGALAFTVAP